MRYVGHPVGIGKLQHEHADPVGSCRELELQVLVQVVEVEIHLARDGRAVAPLVNGPDVEFPVARVDGAADRQLVSNFEPV